MATDMPADICAKEKESSDLWIERRSGRSATVWRFWIEEKKSHTLTSENQSPSGCALALRRTLQIQLSATGEDTFRCVGEGGY